VLELAPYIDDYEYYMRELSTYIDDSKSDSSILELVTSLNVYKLYTNRLE